MSAISSVSSAPAQSSQVTTTSKTSVKASDGDADDGPKQIAAPAKLALSGAGQIVDKKA